MRVLDGFAWKKLESRVHDRTLHGACLFGFGHSQVSLVDES